VNAARAAITSPLLEASIEGARGILLNIASGPDLGLFEVNEAAEIIHSVAHADANIIFGAVIDENIGDEVRVTVIAAGFERWEDSRAPERPAERERGTTPGSAPTEERRGMLGLDPAGAVDIFAEATDDEIDLGDDEFDVPSFLK